MGSKRFALCVGNNDYDSFGKLEYAINDSQEMKAELEKFGFATQQESNLKHNELYLIDDCLDVVASSDYDVFLFYYAGHGVQIDGNNYLIPVDSQNSFNNNQLKKHSYDLKDLLDKLDCMPDKIKIVILDCCRNTVRGSNFGFAPINAPQNTIIAFSTSPNCSAFEDEETRHGKYTMVLLSMINLPRVPIETMFKRVRQRLISLTGGQQVSWEHSSLISNFYFNTDTAYDNYDYSTEALKDNMYIFKDDSLLKNVINLLKSNNFYRQNESIVDLLPILKNNCEKISKNELFVLGRNILQAADGGSWGCERFITDLPSYDFTIEIKNHIMCGLLYEMYYDKNGSLRNRFKNRVMDIVFKSLFDDFFIEARNFLRSNLEPYENTLLFIPGIMDVITIDVIMTKPCTGRFNVASMYFNGAKLKYSCPDDCQTQMTKYGFKKYISKIIMCPESHLRLSCTHSIDEDDMISFPYTDFLFVK